ncbi:MAG: hypothetical protein CFH19_00087 [Alphaproteobacteria bacterium MarineAlpha5_Bin9]|nr:MAG: hypothetical protein CFH19_00087 [Alphaproteobacteria bacterium MarineAlpha5_Bin9]
MQTINPFLWIILEIIDLYKIILIAYIIMTWLITFNIFNTSNRFIFSLMQILYKLSEPSLRIVRNYIPTMGNIDIAPIIVFIALIFIQRLLIYYWPI